MLKNEFLNTTCNFQKMMNDFERVEVARVRKLATLPSQIPNRNDNSWMQNIPKSTVARLICHISRKDLVPRH